MPNATGFAPVTEMRAKLLKAQLEIYAALFQLIANHMVRSIEGGSIDIGVLV